MKSETFRGLANAARPGALSVALLFAVAALAGCSHPDKQAAADASTTPQNVTLTKTQLKRIHFYTVAPSSYRNTVDATGVVGFDDNQATSVMAPISGPVTRLLVNPGDQVKKGQPLAMVASPDFAASISAYRKAVDSARTARKLADQDKDLVKHQGVSEREAEQAQTDASNAEADRNAALQALLGLGVDPKDIKAVQAGLPIAHIEGMIRAPIAGTVVQRSITVGQLLQAGSTPCFTIADLSRVWVKTQLFGSDPALVKAGDSAEIDMGDGSKPLAGKVTYVAAEVDPDTRATLARVQVDNPDGLLKKQMYVSVKIHSANAETGLRIPVEAILRDDENLPFVYVAQPDGSFARKHVTLGARNDGQYVITKGLRSGDRVVIDGSIFLMFMQTQ
ncbi:MAG: efflux RND transporter periplasmic adaptor subunit [Rhodanobacter sp.]|nr:MAG: efflux RND transporter periplasmic adaptor subunit [Rhodanobacter sp.]